MERNPLLSRWLLAALISLSCSLPAVTFASDDNPPGPRGGPGTNWENPPGPRGGPGASPDRRDREVREVVKERVVVVNKVETPFRLAGDGYYYHPNYGYYYPGRGFWNQSAQCWWDRDDNPPGPAGGPGTNWENPPGYRGGPGASPDRYGPCR
jgi:hypothetical protein